MRYPALPIATIKPRLHRVEPTTYRSARWQRVPDSRRESCFPDGTHVLKSLWTLCVRCATPTRLLASWADLQGPAFRYWCDACKDNEERQEHGTGSADPRS